MLTVERCDSKPRQIAFGAAMGNVAAYVSTLIKCVQVA